MVDPEQNDQGYQRIMSGLALGVCGALMIGLFIFMLGFAIGWGQDSIGAGLVMGILAPAACLGATAVACGLSASALARKNWLLACVSFMFVLVVVVVSLYFYFSKFMPFVDDATNVSAAWKGHRLPVWWYPVSGLLGILSAVAIFYSIRLSSGVLSTQKANGNVKTS